MNTNELSHDNRPLAQAPEIAYPKGCNACEWPVYRPPKSRPMFAGAAVLPDDPCCHPW